GIPRIASPGLADRVASELQRGKPRQVANPPRDHLVDRDAGADGGRALVQANAGQERARAPRVVAGPILATNGRLVIKAAENLKLPLEQFERLESPPELKLPPLALRPPPGRDRSVREVDERRAQGRTGRGRRQARPTFRGNEPGAAQRREGRKRD